MLVGATVGGLLEQDLHGTKSGGSGLPACQTEACPNGCIVIYARIEMHAYLICVNPVPKDAIYGSTQSPL